MDVCNRHTWDGLILGGHQELLFHSEISRSFLPERRTNTSFCLSILCPAEFLCCPPAHYCQLAHYLLLVFLGSLLTFLTLACYFSRTEAEDCLCQAEILFEGWRFCHLLQDTVKTWTSSNTASSLLLSQSSWDDVGISFPVNQCSIRTWQQPCTEHGDYWSQQWYQ